MRGPGGPADFQVGAPIGTGHHPRGIAAGDADGDGCAEVFVSVQTSTLVEVWTRDARASSFVPRALDSLGVGRGPLDLCLSDVDGDGVLDVCVANAFSNDVSVLYGTHR
jgi:hypothetical protein